MGNVHGIHHIAMKCAGEKEYEAAVAFYRDVLEIPVKRVWKTGTMLDTGSGLLEIFNDADAQLPQGVWRHVALAVKDVDALVERVRAAGFPITTEPKDICIPSDPPLPARIAFCLGAVGEEIELFCEK